MTKKLTVKYLAMRVAVLEDLIGQLVGNPEVAPSSTLVKEAREVFGPVMDYGKVIKMLSDQKKDNIKKERKRVKADLKKAEKKIQKSVKKEAKAAKKANKTAKLTKTTPEKGKKYSMPPETQVNKAYEGLGNQ